MNKDIVCRSLRWVLYLKNQEELGQTVERIRGLNFHGDCASLWILLRLKASFLPSVTAPNHVLYKTRSKSRKNQKTSRRKETKRKGVLP